MSMKRKYESQKVALAEPDRQALARIAAEQNKAKAQVAREAIRWYCENHESLQNAEREDKVTTVMMKCTNRLIGVIAKTTNRICALLVRSAIDTNMVLMLLYRHLPEQQADEIMQKMYRMAVTRLQRKLSAQEARG